MSRLEKFIKEHREEFDDVAPPAELWNKVEDHMAKKNGQGLVIRPWIKWAAAAAIVVMIACGLFFIIGKEKTTAEIAIRKDALSAPDLTALAPEEAPQMNQFAKMIAVKQEELKSLAKEQPSLYAKFAKDIIQLDSSYNTLKHKLSITPNREVLIEAMIQNLELQLNVLNQQLNIIKQIKNFKKNSHEKNQSFT